MRNRLKKFFYEELEEKEFIHSRYLSLIGWIFSVVLIFGVWSLSERYFDNQAQIRFEHHVDEEVYRLQARLKEYENLLRVGGGFFESSDYVSRSDWYAFVHSVDLDHNYPGMLGLGFSRMMMPNEVAIIEEKMRREGYSSFALKPKGYRPIYSSILYLEPLNTRNRVAIGYDMYSEPVRREAMDRARDTGWVIASGKVTLIQEIDQNIQAGVLIYCPYYAEGEAADSVQKRRKSLIGYVYAPLRIGDFIAANFKHKHDMYIKIYEGDGKRDEALLYSPSELHNYPSEHFAERVLYFGGRQWHLYFSSTSAFDARNDSHYPVVFAVIGLIIYLAMMYIIVELLKSRSLLSIKTEALEHEKEAAQNYLDIVEVMVLVLDTEYKIQVINRRGSEILGYSAEEAIGKNFIELFIPERIRPQMKTIAEILIQPNGYEYNENPILTKDGSERLIAWRNRRLYDEDGTIIGILSSGEDITDIRRTQLQLQESEAFYRTLFGSIEESIVILNEDRIIDCNEVALRLFDTVREDFIGRSIFETSYEIECQDYSLNRYITVAYGGEFTSARCTLRLYKNPDMVKIVDFSFSRFGSESENKLVMISRDITRKVEEEKLLTLHGRQAQMGEMISMIAHQWRQPLAIINAITSQMRLKALINESEDTEFIENLIKIEQQSSHLSQTISDYRDFFRPDKPKERFKVGSVIDHALNLIDHALKNHSIHIQTSGVEDVTLYTYRNELLQVLIVLLKNALDAFLENKIVSGEIVISAYKQGENCVIRVYDNAGGIPKEVVHKLFSPYFTTKNDGFGTGLGLYMSRTIIQDHCGGSIEVSSEGNTTTMTITLPYEGEL